MVAGEPLMSFWFPGRKRAGQRAWYSVSIPVPALLLLAMLLCLAVAKLLRIVMP